MTTLNTPRGQIVIRPATPDDVEAYREMRLECLQLHPEAFGADYQTSLDYPPEYWTERIINTPYKVMMLAVGESGELIGMAGVMRNNMAKTEHAGSIISVYVRVNWRGLRVTDALIDACMQWGRDQGMRIMRLAVAANNPAAIRTYLRCGFSIYGVEAESLYVDGKYIDEFLMQQRL